MRQEWRKRRGWCREYCHSLLPITMQTLRRLPKNVNGIYDGVGLQYRRLQSRHCMYMQQWQVVPWFNHFFKLLNRAMIKMIKNIMMSISHLLQVSQRNASIDDYTIKAIPLSLFYGYFIVCTIVLYNVCFPSSGHPAQTHWNETGWGNIKGNYITHVCLNFDYYLYCLL